MAGDRPEMTASARPRAALLAAKADPMACHSIAVWEQINAALAAESGEVLMTLDGSDFAAGALAAIGAVEHALPAASTRDVWIEGFVAACRLHGGDGEGYRAAADRYLAERNANG